MSLIDVLDRANAGERLTRRKRSCRGFGASLDSFTENRRERRLDATFLIDVLDRANGRERLTRRKRSRGGFDASLDSFAENRRERGLDATFLIDPTCVIRPQRKRPRRGFGPSPDSFTENRRERRPNLMPARIAKLSLRLCSKAFLTTTPTCPALCRLDRLAREFDFDQRRGCRLLQALRHEHDPDPR
jgi:hypothetical protein